ncbi:hypothetical protein H0H92_006436 [Tricholoma furcatifolium]|nr:hypothetical protein H0H92_006436 [Tricholoma furcatifolium]
MRLAAVVPPLSGDIVSALENCGIRTDIDLLFKSIIELYRQLPPESNISLLDLKNAVSLTAQSASAPFLSGAEMLAQEKEGNEQAPTLLSGVSDLDSLLGGFGGRRVIEISGDRQTGKTALALNIILRHLSESEDARAVWVDTTGDFSVERAAEILKTFESEASSTALERLQISLAFDIESVYNVLEQLKSSYNVSTDPRPTCVVFDAITPLLSPLLSAVSARGHAVMTDLMRYLRVFARSNACPILVTNHTSLLVPNSDYKSAARKPALGPSFQFMTDATIWLSKHNQDSTSNGEREYTVRSAEVLRSNCMMSKARALFKISQGKVLNV